MESAMGIIGSPENVVTKGYALDVVAKYRDALVMACNEVLKGINEQVSDKIQLEYVMLMLTLATDKTFCEVFDTEDQE